VLAVYLLSDVVRRPNIFPNSPQDELARALESAGKLLILQSQMTRVLGNLPGCHPTEIFAARLRNRALIVGSQLPELAGTDQSEDPGNETVEGQLPRTFEEWSSAQQADVEFEAMLDAVEENALKQDLWICAPVDSNPTIIVPPSFQELLVRDTHQRMFH
jgi:hypothetical protein